MRLRDLKANGNPGMRLAFMILTGVMFTSGCAGNNLPKFGFGKKAESERAEWEKTVADSQANHLDWSTSHAQSVQKASQEGKLLMVNFTSSDSCAWCIKLEEEVFDTPKFQAWVADNVVPLKLDFPKSTKLDRELDSQNKQLLAKYKSYFKGYPTILFLDTQGGVVAKMGYARGGPDVWISKAEEKLRN